jgi:hypothetical protein
MSKRVVTFGEIMLRLATPEYLRFSQTSSLTATFGGGEANVAVSLANYGIKVDFVSRLPLNDIATSCVMNLRKYGVGTDHLIYGGERLGIYFLETGAVARPSKVIYDRAHSSIAEIQPGMIDWRKIFKGADWFHWTGITPAISQGAADACLEAIQIANEMGVTVSTDLNFRKNLWKYGKSASEVMPKLVAGCDVIEPINCKNLLFSDFSTSYQRMWCIHPTYCENIHFKDLTIRSTGGNGDGIDVDSCKHVLIERCDIETGDDCIAIKSGRGMEANMLMRTTEDVYIRNCRLSDSIYACIGIGSETSGGIRGVRIENCRFENTRTHAIYIKSRPGRGAFIEDISAEGLDVSGMQGGFLRFNLMGSGLQDQVPVPGLQGIPTVKNFSFKNVRVRDVKDLVDGTSVHPDKPLEGLVLENISGEALWGIRLANVRKAVLRNINVNIREGDALSIYNVQGKGLGKAIEMGFPHKIEAAIAEPDPPYVLK